MNGKRVLTGLATTIAVLAVVWIDHTHTSGLLSTLVLSAIAFAASYELCLILESTGIATYPRLTAVMSLLVAMAPPLLERFWDIQKSYSTQAGLMFAYVIVSFILALREESHLKGARAVMSGTFVLVYVGFALSFLIRLRNFTMYGEIFLLFAIGAAKVGDMAAYFVGRAVGRHPLAPRISPKKTVEGSLGSVAASMLLAVVVWRFTSVSGGLNLWMFVLWGLILNVAGQFGDLAESLIKRAGGVKDSSSTFGAMGGMLDTVDSILLTAPTAYILALLGGFGVR